MTIVTPADVRLDFDELADEALDLREPIFIRRPGKQGVALIAEDDLRSLMETVHVFSSIENAKRFLAALEGAMAGKTEPMTIDDLRKLVGLHQRLAVLDLRGPQDRLEAHRSGQRRCP